MILLIPVPFTIRLEIHVTFHIFQGNFQKFFPLTLWHLYIHFEIL